MARERLDKSPYTTLRGVACEYRHGVLLLRGQLPSFYHKQLAQEAVARLPGVTQVVNEIEVLAKDRLGRSFQSLMLCFPIP